MALLLVALVVAVALAAVRGGGGTDVTPAGGVHTGEALPETAPTSSGSGTAQGGDAALPGEGPRGTAGGSTEGGGEEGGSEREGEPPEGTAEEHVEGDTELCLWGEYRLPMAVEPIRVSGGARGCTAWMLLWLVIGTSRPVATRHVSAAFDFNTLLLLWLLNPGHLQPRFSSHAVPSAGGVHAAATSLHATPPTSLPATHPYPHPTPPVRPNAGGVAGGGAHGARHRSHHCRCRHGGWVRARRPLPAAWLVVVVCGVCGGGGGAGAEQRCTAWALHCAALCCDLLCCACSAVLCLELTTSPSKPCYLLAHPHPTCPVGHPLRGAARS